MKLPCWRVVTTTEAAHTYYVRLRFISPASETIEAASIAETHCTRPITIARGYPADFGRTDRPDDPEARAAPIDAVHIDRRLALFKATAREECG